MIKQFKVGTVYLIDCFEQNLVPMDPVKTHIIDIVMHNLYIVLHPL